MCPYCYWDTTPIKFACKKEVDLDGLIHQLKDSVNKGLLKKMYDHIQTKLKENEGISLTGRYKRLFIFIYNRH